MPPGKVIAVCLSPRKGVRKREVRTALLVEGHGMEGDAHAGPWHRQVSLLSRESVDTMRAKGLNVSPGSFGENVTTEGVSLTSLRPGQRLRIGMEALLEITQIGKECHDRCAIYRQVGDCVMPREGVFARVLRGGEIRAGDAVVDEVEERKGCQDRPSGPSISRSFR
ncbi:MAG: MOSC domain-containing protein [Elusimicrobiota bacterium]